MHFRVGVDAGGFILDLDNEGVMTVDELQVLLDAPEDEHFECKEARDLYAQAWVGS